MDKLGRYPGPLSVAGFPPKDDGASKNNWDHVAPAIGDHRDRTKTSALRSIWGLHYDSGIDFFCILFVFSPNEYLTPELKLPDRYMDAESGFPPDPRSDEAAHGKTTSASVAIDYKALPCSCQLINNVATPCSSDCKGLQRPSLATREDKRPPIGSWDRHHIHEYCQQHPIN